MRLIINNTLKRVAYFLDSENIQHFGENKPCITTKKKLLI